MLLIGGCTTMPDKAITTDTKYPDKPITLIVPFGVGAGMDLVARLFEKEAPTALGQPLIIINKSGAAGTIAWNELAGAKPDGYTLGMTAVEVILQPLYGPTKYHYPTALDPIAQIANISMVMAVQAGQPWQNLDDLIAYARQHPGQLKFGHAGVGGIGHIAGEAFAKTANINLDQVPFQSGAEAMASLLGGHVQIVFLNPASIKEYINSGAVRALAIADEQRLSDPSYSTVPTFKEQGLDIVCSGWHGISAPKDLPPDVKIKLAEGFKTMINNPEFKRNMENLGLEVTYLGPEETEEKWITENQRLTKMVQETGILDKIKEQKK
jgi:tripartite-type tricarboxylate transporter receptor subunit TctC